MTEGRFYGWKLLAACWFIMFVNLGIPAYGSSGLNALMAPALHLDRRALGLLFSAYMVMSGLPGPLVAISVNRLGARRTLMLGSVLLIAGALLMATIVNSFWAALLTFGLLVGSGVATGGALATQAGVTREALYRALSPTGDPRLSTFLAVMKALGIKVTPHAA